MPASPKKPKATALGTVPAALDILAGPVNPPRSATGTPKVGRRPSVSAKPKVKQRDTGGDGKMQTIYLRANDIERANELEYRVKKARVIPGRIGLSLMVRAGLKLLAAEFDKNESRALQIVQAAATNEE